MTQAIKPTTRLTMSNHRERGKSRQIVVTVFSRWLEFRLYGGRHRLQLDIEAAYHYAALLQARKDRADKAQAAKEARRTKAKS